MYSFGGRRINVSRIDVIEPHLWFEIYPAGSKLVHNFPHWDTGPPSKYEIYQLNLGTMYITNGAFDFLDRRHNIAAGATKLAADIKITAKQNLYAALATSPLFRLRIQDYEPIDVAMRGQFRYTPGVLELTSVSLNGPDLKV